MSMRSYTVITVSLIFSLMMCGRIMAQTPPAPSIDGPGQAQVKMVLDSRLGLARFENVNGTGCGTSIQCSGIEKLACIATACSSGSNGGSPTKCLNESEADASLADRLICQAVRFPTPENIQAFVDAFPRNENNESDFVEGLALIQAINGDGQACQEAIKDSVGSYSNSKKWTFSLLVNMSACRILSKQRTVAEEEEDYFAWHNVPLKVTDCTAIKDAEMKNACFAGVEAP